MKQKVQIVGKVTGLTPEEAVLKFNESETILTRQGCEVINPMKIVPADASWKDAMRICLKSLLEVDAIAVQPDYVLSEGASLEYLVAVNVGTKIIEL
jgi:hypothetical protein